MDFKEVMVPIWWVTFFPRISINECLGRSSCRQERSTVMRVTVLLPSAQSRFGDPASVLGGVDRSALTLCQFGQLHFISLNFSCKLKSQILHFCSK